jgi:hypothetical protein
MTHAIVCITLVALLAASCASTPTPPPADPAPAPAAPSSPPPYTSAWPALPGASGFVSGHPATPEDVQAGRAVFAAQTGSSGDVHALPIVIPQYAFCAPDGAPIPGIVVQAEHTQGTDVVGFRPLAGAKPYVTLLSGCNLLGQVPPRTE